jgi:IclR family transcriptional regulator, acetate operon repressor
VTETAQLVVAGDEATIRSVERALRLLVVTAESDDGIGLVDAARAVGLAPSTVTRMLRTLESTGFVERRNDSTYVAGPELIRLGALHSSESPLQRLIQPHLDELATVTGESCYLAVPVDDEMATYVRMAPSAQAVRHVSWLGRRIPRRGSAMGAALDGRVATNGAVVVHAGVEADTTAVAVPIRVKGQIVGAINVVGPSFRVNKAKQSAIAAAAVATATAVQLSL